jgi:hypothetical protein
LKYLLNRRFDPDAPGEHADTVRNKADKSAIPSAAFLAEIPEARQV